MIRRALRRPVLLVAVLAALAAVALMLPAPFPGHAVSSNDLIAQVSPFAASGSVDAIQPKNVQMTDPAQVFRPDLRWARDEVRSGHLPTWDPFVFGGWPLLASQQAAPLFPPNAVSYVLPYEESIGVGIVLVIVLAAVGTFLFARTIGLGHAAASLSALAYALSAPMILWSMHPHGGVHALLGWMMLGAEGTLRGRRWGVPVLAAALGFAVLAGHPQSVMLDGIVVLAWCVRGLLARGDAIRERARRGLRLAGAGILGVAAGAVMLLPFVEMLGETGVRERGGVPGPDLTALWSLAVPDVWGRPDFAYQVDLPGLANYVERTAYLGVLPALLAGVGLLLRFDGLRRFFLGVGLVAVVVAFRVPGISEWLVAEWPLRLASVARAISVLVFCVALLAGLGLQAALDRPRDLLRPRALAAAGVLTLLPLAWLVSEFQPRGGLGGALGSLPWLSDPSGPAEAAAAAGARWGLLAVAGGVALAALVRYGARARVPVAAGIVLLTLVDLGVGWHGYVPVLPVEQARLAAPASIDALRTAQGSQRTTAGAALGGPQPLVPNTGSYFGLRDPRGRGVPTLARTTTAWGALGGAAAPNFAFVDSSDAVAARALRAFGVTAVMVVHGAPVPPGGTPLHRGTDGDVYGLADVVPRAFVTCRWTPASAADAPTVLAGLSARDLQERPVVETGRPGPAGCDRAPSAVSVVRDAAREVRLDVSSSAGGRLVLLDTHYPGWVARVDGRETAIEAANVAFRSIELPATASEVRFSYEPASVRNGAGISLLAWSVIGALLALPWWRRRRAGR